MNNDYVPRPHKPVDQKEVTLMGLRACLEKSLARDDRESAAIYEDAIAKRTGEHPSKLF